jgi:hypothetical protein
MHIGANKYARNLGGAAAAARTYQRNAIAEDPDYSKFVVLLYHDLDDLIHHLQANPQRRHQAGEDALTDQIVMGLHCMGYDASHDKSSGGHVDLTIELGPHTWIGEAKKNSKYSEGYRQLVSRYRPASGNFDHNHAGLILYSNKKTDLLSQRNTWLSKFKADFSGVYSPISYSACPISSYAFFTDHKHPVSGKPFWVRHMMVGLHFSPTDASARASRGRKKVARTKKKAKP